MSRKKRKVSAPTWRVSYQVWSLDTTTEIFCFGFKLCQDQVPRKLTKPGASDKPDEFSFPVAFSSSLRVAAILDNLIKIEQSAESTPQYRCISQVINAFGCRNTLTPSGTLWYPNTPICFVNQNAEGLGHRPHVRHSMEDHECYEWFQYYVSPSEKFFVLLEGTGPPGKVEVWRTWVVSIYQVNWDHRKTNSVLIASVGVSIGIYYISPDSFQRSGGVLCFHPYKPVLAISTLSMTAIWQFTEERK
jgi:hypothetical protein